MNVRQYPPRPTDGHESWCRSQAWINAWEQRHGIQSAASIVMVLLVSATRERLCVRNAVPSSTVRRRSLTELFEAEVLEGRWSCLQLQLVAMILVTFPRVRYLNKPLSISVQRAPQTRHPRQSSLAHPKSCAATPTPPTPSPSIHASTPPPERARNRLSHTTKTKNVRLRPANLANGRRLRHRHPLARRLLHVRRLRRRRAAQARRAHPLPQLRAPRAVQEAHEPVSFLGSESCILGTQATRRIGRRDVC